MKKTIFILAAAAMSLAACNKAVLNAPVEYGFIDFNVSSDDVVVETKAVSAEDLNAYSIYCNNSLLGTYGSIKEQVFTKSVGTYSVYAENMTATDAETGFGALRVASPISSITVEANETATATLACVAQSSKLTVTFDKSFTDVFTDYSFEVRKTDSTPRADNNLSLTITETSAKSIFYNGDVALTYTIKGTHPAQGECTFGGTVTIAKGHSLAVTVKQSTESGGLKIEVSANDSLINDEDKNVTVDPYNPSNNL